MKSHMEEMTEYMKNLGNDILTEIVYGSVVEQGKVNQAALTAKVTPCRVYVKTFGKAGWLPTRGYSSLAMIAHATELNSRENIGTIAMRD